MLHVPPLGPGEPGTDFMVPGFPSSPVKNLIEKSAFWLEIFVCFVNGTF